MLNKFNNLNLNIKNIIVLSSLVIVFLIVNISTSINNYFETFEQEQRAKVYSLLQASITASNNILKDQEDPNATKLLKREFVQKFLSSTNKKQTVLNSKLYASNPFVAAEDLGNKSANDSKVKITYQQENENFEKNKLNNFSKEAIKNSKNKLFHFSLNEDTKFLEAFYSIKVSKNMLSEYGDISNDLDGDGFNSLGFKMPGWKEGEIHSGFYAKIDISENISNLYSSILVSTLIQILVGVVLIFIFVNLLGRSTSYSLNKIKLGLDSFFSFLNRESSSCKTIEVTTSDILGQMAFSINENIENTQVVIKEDNALIDEAQKVIDEVKVGNLDNSIKSITSNKSLEAFKNDVNEMILVTKNHFQKINEILEQYAKYNYLNELKLEGIKKGSAFDSLSKDINTLRQAITEMLVENKKNGLVLTQSSEVLINNVAVLNENSSSAAASLEETAAALDEITSNVSNNNIHVREMASLASKLTNSANEGQSLASKTTEAMDEINNEVEAINNAISIIDQIAFQTNILSLNAAVEAATAGEAGKGFAVVAGEVRNLASRSAEAAKEIKELIEKATLKATEGKNISDEMIKGYEELNNNVIKTTKLISDIDSASKEQETGILQINDTVNSLDKQTQENANIAEQTNSIASQTDKISKVIIQNANEKEFVGKDSVKIELN